MPESYHSQFMNQSVQASAYTCLMQTEVDKKLSMTQYLFDCWHAESLVINDSNAVESIFKPGKPQKPELVAPRELAKRSAHSEQGKAALVHSIAHIEFNAINLALDAVYRFRQQPKEFYADWLRVAKEEAYHFTLLLEYLTQLGYKYGDFTAHNGLWEMALETEYDVLVRMALVPRVMEARGLDVTPGIIAKLQQAGDQRMVEILQIIQRDEVGHVEIGNRWYRYYCEQRQIPPLNTFKRLVKKHLKGGLRGPYDFAMRKKAGFTDDELKYLAQVGEE